MPFLRVEPYEDVVGLHLHPTHLIRDIDPALGFEELYSAELGTVVWHVVEHIEENGVGEGLNRAFGQSFRLAHIVALRNSTIDLEAVIIVSIVQVLPLLTTGAEASPLVEWSLHVRRCCLIVANL